MFPDELLSLAACRELGALILKVARDADREAASYLDDALRTFRRSEPAVFIVDLTDVRYFDSVAIGALVRSARTCDAFGGQLRLVVTPQSNVERILVIAGLERHFRTYASIEDALSTC
jgi:anti-anti-sigma factor